MNKRFKVQSSIAYTKNQLMSWSNDKRAIMEVEDIGWTFFLKKKKVLGVSSQK